MADTRGPMDGDIPPARIQHAAQLAVGRPFHTLSALEQQHLVDQAEARERAERQARRRGQLTLDA